MIDELYGARLYPIYIKEEGLNWRIDALSTVLPPHSLARYIHRPIAHADETSSSALILSWLQAAAAV